MKYLKNTYEWSTLFAILSLIILLGLLSGCSTFGKKEKAEFEPGTVWIEDMRARVEGNIEDQNKKTLMLALVDQTEKDVQEVDRLIWKLYADFSELSENYHSTPDEFRTVITEFEANRRVVRDRIIESRFKMRELSTPEEWKRLTDNSKRKGLYRQTIRQPGQ